MLDIDVVAIIAYVNYVSFLLGSALISTTFLFVIGLSKTVILWLHQQMASFLVTFMCDINLYLKYCFLSVLIGVDFILLYISAKVINQPQNHKTIPKP